jgi:mono/diheme cytochrome c family protein
MTIPKNMRDGLLAESGSRVYATLPVLVRLLILLPLLALLQGCGRQDSANTGNEQVRRWYTAAQVETGSVVFQQHCAQCHGEQAQGLSSDWRETLADGSFPPPPLNGTAHAWHHPRSVLLQVLDQGGAEFGGKMPAFADILDEEQKLAVIAFFQSYWADEIYAQWLQMGGTN